MSLHSDRKKLSLFPSGEFSVGQGHCDRADNVVCRKEPPMIVTNRQSGTNVHEVADGIYRINTPVKIPGAGGFSFNQFLIVDDGTIGLCILHLTRPKSCFRIFLCQGSPV